MEEYKPNSHKYKERQRETEGKKVEKVVKGSVKAKKKNEAKKLADTFLSEDISSVKDYIVMDVLVPAVKKAVSDIITNGIDMLLYGEAGHAGKNTRASRVSYGKYYGERDSRPARTSRGGYDYDDIILESRGEAEEVLSRMDELIDTYEVVSVADLYDLVGITGNYTDNKYGWTDIRSAKAVRVRDGYMLKMPRALPLN